MSGVLDLRLPSVAQGIFLTEITEITGKGREKTISRKDAKIAKQDVRLSISLLTLSQMDQRGIGR